MNSPPSNTSSATPFTRPAATWNERFAAAGYLFGTAPNTWLRERASAWPAGRHVLCVADGEGRNSVWLAGQGHRVDAFDIAEVGVAKARVLAAEQGAQVNFSVHHCDNYPWPVAGVDAVVAIFVQFADPAMRSRMFEHMARSLRPGGQLLLLGYTPQQLVYKTGGPGVLSHLYTEDLLRDLARSAGLRIDELQAFEDDLAEGPGHHGRSALVGLVGTAT
jgi:SAM-dependent methyltransferase